MSEEALAAIRRCSSVGGARLAAQSRPVDLYHRGQGHRFTVGAAELATLVRRGLEDSPELAQCGAALLVWLGAENVDTRR